MDTKRTMRQAGMVAGLAAVVGLGMLATPASADNDRWNRPNDLRHERGVVRQELRNWDRKFNDDYRNDYRRDHDGWRDRDRHDHRPYRADGWYDQFGIFHYYDRHR